MTRVFVAGFDGSRAVDTAVLFIFEFQGTLLGRAGSSRFADEPANLV